MTLKPGTYGLFLTVLRDVLQPPRGWLLAVVLCLQPVATAAASPGQTGEPQADAVPILRFPPETPLPLQHGALVEAGRFVLRDQGAWEALWGQVQGARQPLPPAPDVDFHEYLVVVAAMGRQRSGGYAIRVEQAQVQAGKLVVTVREESPGPGCMVTMSLTAPIDVVLLPATAEEVEFRSVQAIRRCD